MLTAYCDRSGTIGFCPATCPDGTLPIASHANDALLRGAIAAVARYAHDNNTLLVPGLPEAGDGETALNALITFTARVRERLAADLDHIQGQSTHAIVPRDGDVAHRRGFRAHENPFTPGTDLHTIWDDDWHFRDRSVNGRSDASRREEKSS
ncbi:MAG: hypothetical protein PHT60_13945 [Acidiphilium sp.]|nr:hypothetical protein [Acidiphilium sp.]MDD4936867.1 hypothetical protein [Acidiphilium sp.]